MKISSLPKSLAIVAIIIICFIQSGCAILNIPGKVIGGAFGVLDSIVKGIFKVAEKVPAPPPGVF